MKNFPSISCEHFPDYNQLCTWLRQYAEAAPGLCRLTSIGKSREGRDMLLLEITDFSTGTPETKPALYLQAELHSLELGRLSCLYVIKELIENHHPGDVLSNHTFYILPTINPDSAELVIKKDYPFIRSRMVTEKPEPNMLMPQDIDGDGKVQNMLMAHPDGQFVKDPKDPRLLIPRTPDSKGPFYRLLPEGLINDWNGSDTFDIALDSNWNRNWPYRWDHTPMTRECALNEPELKVAADFMYSRPNICITISIHVGGDLVLSSPDVGSENDIEGRDFEVIKVLRQLGAECMGNESRCGMELNTPPWRWQWPFADRPGSYIDYCYHHLGLLSFDLETAGLYRNLNVSISDIDALKSWDEFNALQRATVQWYEKQPANKLEPIFVPWRTFQHPQLGEVELGGLRTHILYTRLMSEIPEEAHRITTMITRYTEWMPKAGISDIDVQKLPGADDLYSITARGLNLGKSSSTITHKGESIYWAPKLRLELQPAEGVMLVTPPRFYTFRSIGAYGTTPECRWLVKCPIKKDTLGKLVFHGIKAGTAEKTIVL